MAIVNRIKRHIQDKRDNAEIAESLRFFEFAPWNSRKEYLSAFAKREVVSYGNFQFQRDAYSFIVWKTFTDDWGIPFERFKVIPQDTISFHGKQISKILNAQWWTLP